MDDTPIIWLGSALENIRAFPDDARQEVGYQLRRVQRGESPTDWRPISIVGPGVLEIRVHTSDEFRVFYIAKFAEAVYVLHAFQKHTQKTPRREIEMAQRRYGELRRIRQRKKRK
jgi:phage-related protein